MAGKCSRRSFVKRAAMVAGAAVCAPYVMADGAPNSKLGTAVIGSGGQGGASVNEAVGERLIALVDVDDNRLAETTKNVSKAHPNVKTYFDYRKMLDECHKDIDAVFIATPDQHHAPAAIRCIDLGKHVYVEKPMAYCLYEVRKLTESARAKKVMTQLGNQGHSGEEYRRLCEYIWAGAIGQVKETHSWTTWKFGNDGKQPPNSAPPKNLHWDEWLGPTLTGEYNSELHPMWWRKYINYGTGSTGDQGCHVMDGVFWALKLKSPTTFELIEQRAGSKDRWPVLNTIRYDFPARGDMGPVSVYWHDGCKPPICLELEKKNNRKFEDHGTIYVGEKGTMYTGQYGGGIRIIPEEQHKATPQPPKTIPRIRTSHRGDFLRACKGSDVPPSSNFEYSGPLTEFVLLGHLAYMSKPGQKVEWDGEKMEAKGAPELNKLIKREYRKGWEV
ncbi:MAG: Gfo/Idh/MocA family oxidoreductase [Planctomycetota bacterium]|nr:Gfo/Idh/MocA family oxidoreductase [Planctomycetota bacterium]